MQSMYYNFNAYHYVVNCVEYKLSLNKNHILNFLYFNYCWANFSDI